MPRKTSRKPARSTPKAGPTAARPAGRKAGQARGSSASRKIDARIAALDDWRGVRLAQIRRLIQSVDPDVVEEWKWMGSPTWSHDGVFAVASALKDKVKLTFAHGAALPDPQKLFNATLGGGTWRAIDFKEGAALDERALAALVRAAVAHNTTSKAAGKAKPVLLAGGNPQIPKGDGDSPVQAYLAAMPGWKRALGRRLDALVVRTVPGVRKAVKWNSPLYGVEGQGWFLSLHCFNEYVKVAFFRGASLRPLPPGGSRQKDVRYLDIREDDELDEARFAAWVAQASRLPGERM
ncbi:MAG TPA: DUF1801 domain-containing protein [Planctomycetota bacterium]